MKLTLYYRENCHLCDSMRSALAAYNNKISPIEWDEMDIDRSQLLVDRFNHKVPVLCYLDEEICHHFLDVRMLQGFIDKR